MRSSIVFTVAAALLGVACGDSAVNTPAPGPDGGTADVPASADVPVADAAPRPRTVPVLGGGMHTPASVRVTVVATADDELSTPRDLAFNPEAPDQLWIVNYGRSNATIIRNIGTDQRDVKNERGRGYDHFMTHPSSIAFGAPNIMATCHEMDRVTQPSTPADFMGPTLWDSTYDDFENGDNSHIDMLHNSPNAVGIAWEADNVYWVVDGAHRSLTRYDFMTPHARSGTDHRTANVRRFAEGMLTFTRGVSAHAEFDHESGYLYVCDPGSHRVLRFNAADATMGTRITPNYDGCPQNRMTGGTMEAFIEGDAGELQAPSGIALVGDLFYVTDNTSSRITAFDREGRRIDWLDLSSEVPSGGLQGITLDARGYIYVVDSMGNRVIEIAPRGAQ